MKELEKINWILVSQRCNRYLCSNTLIFFKQTCPIYLHDVYRQSGQNQANTGYIVSKLKHPSRNALSGQKKFVVSDTNSLEQFVDGPQVAELT